jgi:hypothetical protein
MLKYTDGCGAYYFMKLHLKSISPTPYDVALCSFLTLLVTLVGNAYQVFTYYVLRPSDVEIHLNTHEAIAAMLARIDSFRPSAAIITFLFWAFVGLLVLAALQGVHHALRRVSYLRRISSKRYIHPPSFTRSAFWKQWALTSVGSFVAFCVALFLVCFFVLCIVPVGIMYTRVFLFFPSVFNIFYGLMGLTLLFIGLILLFVAARLVHRRRRLIRLA